MAHQAILPRQRHLLLAEAGISERSLGKRLHGAWLQPALEERLDEAAHKLGIKLPPHAPKTRPDTSKGSS